MRIGVNDTHAKVEEGLIGHELQIEALSKELRMTPQYSDYACPYASVFFVSGPHGIGKRTFIKRLLKNDDQHDIPRIIYRIDPHEVVPIDGQIKELARSNQAYFSRLLEQLSVEMDEKTRKYEESGRKLPQIGKLALWSGLFRQRIYENREIEALQILFVLHDISELSELHRKLLAQVIPKGNRRIDVRIIATDINDEAEQEFYDLFWDRAPTARIVLPSLELKDIERWLYVKERPIELASEILERSDGLPTRLEAAYESLILERDKGIQDFLAEKFLGSINGNLRKFVCMASLLPEVDKDSLRAILPEDSLTDVLAVLHENNWPDCFWNNDSFYFGQRVSRGLQSWLSLNDKMIFDQTKGIAGQLYEICTVIPSYEDRDTLAGLVAFNYFDKQAVITIMPEIADRAITLMSQKSRLYFEKSGSNLRIRPEIRQIVEVYSKLTMRPDNPAIRAKIGLLWKTRKKVISDNLSLLVESVDRDAKDLASIKRRMYNIYAKNSSECLSNHKAPAGSISDNTSNCIPKGKIASLVMQAIGTGILYICLLSSSRMSAVFAIFGLTLIVSGLFTDNSRTEVIPRANPAEALDNSDDAVNDDFRINTDSDKVSELRCELEMKESWLASKIAVEKQEIHNLERQMEEPYAKE